MSDLNHVICSDDEQIDIEELIDSTESAIEEKAETQNIANAVVNDMNNDYRVHIIETIKLILDRVEILERKVSLLQSIVDPGSEAE